MDTKFQFDPRARWLMLALLALFFAFGLFDHSLWSSNDTREGAMIAAMARGDSWTLPELNGEPYLEKPPLLHWTGATLCRLTGVVNEGMVRLPAALYGFGSVLLVWLFGRALGRERAGLIAAALCSTALLMLEYSKIVLTDTALTFVVMLSLWLFWRAYTATTWRVLRYFLFLLASAVAFYAKGLLGPGFVWVAVGSFLLWRREWKLLFVLPLAFLPFFALVLAPWVCALWLAGGRDYLIVVFWDNQFGRFLSFHDPSLPLDPYFVHKEPIWYYLKSAPLRLLPWTLLVIAALGNWFRRGSAQRGDLALFLRIALVTMAAVLHVSAAKTACYLLPLFPILFLMTGVWLEDALHSGVARRWERAALGLTAGTLTILALIAPFGALAANICFARFNHGSNYRLPPGLTSYSLALAAVALALAGLFVRRLLRWWRAGLLQDIAWHGPQMFITLILLNLAAVLPVLEAAKSYRPLTDLVREHVGTAGRIGFTSDEERDIGALTFYLGRNVDFVATDESLVEYLFTGSQSVGVIISADQFAAVRDTLLTGCPVQYLRVTNGGYKSRDYWLVVPRS
ncbi:MAG: glycosyltransferase family 39 protein [Kiritimatiellaeota bacterium]|nr:glycosyltransferase family 39 protein [Kiritimatiellota bacterium]